MREEGKPVLYVAFGTQVEISTAQFREIQIGLEKSAVNFLWLVRKNASELEEGFEERVRSRGMVVKEWVDQREILEHETVRGFLCHCGWSSVMESICAKVPILAWPMMWEQPLNARMVVDVAGVGLRVESCNGFVDSEVLAKAAKELMEGGAGEKVRKKAEEVGRAAVKAVEEGGSSWKALDQLINELHA
ncbi:UNVERIFIED_CONTAM: UDP-glycosyltransferase 90A1 [Sesamum radiatum]|uniref:UDP-glycosyltransferase 90A1 n=1 Tax=Sesamum radiatum TaxID=300843 RepID=A0AAW2QFL7_SESRA